MSLPTTDYISQLSNELILEIFDILNIFERTNACAVSKRFNGLAKDSLAWHKIFSEINSEYGLETITYPSKCFHHLAVTEQANLWKKQKQFILTIYYQARSSGIILNSNVQIKEKIDQSIIKDTIEVWRQIQKQALIKPGKAIYITNFDFDILKSKSAKEIIKMFDKWIEENKDNIDIKYLDLSYKRLVYLPSAIGKLNQLVRLYLRENEITSLPESIGNLAQLRFLDLYNTKIRTLPQSIDRIKHHCKINFLFLPAGHPPLS